MANLLAEESLIRNDIDSIIGGIDEETMPEPMPTDEMAQPVQEEQPAEPPVEQPAEEPVSDVTSDIDSILSDTQEFRQGEQEMADSAGEGIPEESTQSDIDAILGTKVEGVDAEEKGNQEGIMFWVFDKLNRPHYGVANVAKEMMDASDRFKKEWEFSVVTPSSVAVRLGQAIMSDQRDELAREPLHMAGAFWKGLSGQEKASFGEILTERGFPYPNAFGLLLDIGSDPMNYLPFGLFMKPFEAVGKTQAWSAVVNTQFMKWAKQIFLPKGLTSTEYHEYKLLSKYRMQAKELEAIENLAQMSKGLKTHELELLSQVREHPELVSQLSPFQLQKLDEFADAFYQMGQEALDAGLISAENFATLQERYVPHITRGMIKKLRTGELPPTMFEKTAKGFFQKKRRFETLDEMEAYAMETLNPDFMPERNLAKVFGIRKIEQIRSLAKTEYINGVLTNFGHKVTLDAAKQLPEGYRAFYPVGRLRMFKATTLQEKKLLSLLESNVEKGSDLIEYTDEILDAMREMTGITTKVPVYALPEEIAKDMNKVTKFLIGDPATHKALRFIDKTTGMWKTLATVYRVPFHVRNFQSNAFLMWLGGVDGVQLPNRMRQALAVQKGWNGVVKLPNGNTLTYDQLRKVAEEYGVRGKSWIGGDISEHILDEIEKVIGGKSIAQKFKEMPKTMTEFFRSVGVGIEDNARLGLFIDALQKGEDYASAARRVRKYLFDYTELSWTEQNIFKRAVPFYTWMRKNIPLQITQIIEQPEKYAHVGKAFDTAFRKWNESAEEIKNKPDYMKNMAYIKTDWKSEEGNPVYMFVDLPYLELQKLADWKGFLGMLTPYKLIPEMIFNMKHYPQPFEKIEAVRGYSRVPAPVWVAYLPKEILNSRVLNAGAVLDKVSGKKVLGIRALALHAMYNMFPPLSEISRVYPMSVSLEEERAPYRGISYVTGVKLMPVNQKVQRRMLEIEEMAKARKIQDVARNWGAGLGREDIDILLEKEVAGQEYPENTKAKEQLDELIQFERDKFEGKVKSKLGF